MKRDAFIARQGQRERLKQILTEEQLEKFEALRSEREEGPRNRPRLREDRFERQRIDRFRGPREQMMRRRMDRFKEEKKEDGGN